MKVERIILVCVMSIIVGLGVWLLRENSTSLTIITSVFITSVGSFLGLDLLKMVKETKILPEGDYKMMEKWKYYLCLGVFLLYIAEAIWIEAYYSLSIPVPMGMFISGAVIVLGVMLSGLKANALVTDNKKE